MRDYEDFELRISADGEGFRAQAKWAGESQKFDLDAGALAERWKRLSHAFTGQGRATTEEVQEAEALGGELFRAVFTGRILRAWSDSLARADERNPKEVVRLLLRVQEAGPLASLPWELLFDADHQSFLALSEKTPVLRYPDVPRRKRPLAVRPPLRLLGVLAEPLGQPLLDLEGEWQAMEKALAPLCAKGLVEMERLSPPTLPKLRERLQREKPAIHVLHFAGHAVAGEFDFETNPRDRHREPAPGQQLATLVADASDLRLVVINACEGACGIGEVSTASLAFHLARTGLPAVVALQASIGDKTARIYSRELYEEIAKGNPLDAAVTQMRRALYAEHKGLTWAAPVLFLRGSGTLILGKIPWWRIFLLGLAVAVAFGIALATYKGKCLYDRLIHSRPHSLVMRRPDPDCPSPQGLDFAFVKINPGGFTMGAPARRGDRAEERPAHKVKITRSFCVSAYEVTESQWNAGLAGAGAPTRPGFDLPKVSVTWNEIQDYLAKLNQRDPGADYRLLWEAELEYSGRAGSSAAYVFGDREKDLRYRANCLDTCDAYDEVAPIGSFDPNLWGLYDVHGNVEEWVEDRYAPYSPGGELLIDPQGPPLGADRVRRGGSWAMKSKNCASWSRKSSQPDYKSNDLGFRIARSPVIAGPPRPASPTRLP